MASLSRLVIGEPLSRLSAALAKDIRDNAKVMVIADAAVAGRFGAGLTKGLKKAGFDASMITVASGERSKTLAQAVKLYRALARARWERKSTLIALGGGVVGDLTGFVAATYLRGVPYVQVPTTLLAQVDSSIGGKTGVDIAEGKNLVGSFYHPRLIWIDPALLKTLPEKHWRNGLAEVIKYGAIRDAALFERLERKIDRLVQGYSPEWDPIIRRCAEIKMDVVRKDPMETLGLRALLNFGHSVGHAVEAAAGYRLYLHGEAISIGMFVAAALSVPLGFDAAERIRLGMLLTKAGLPSRVRHPISRTRLFEFLARDKKSQSGSVRFVLLKRLGEAVSGQSVSGAPVGVGARRLRIMKNETLELLKKSSPLLVASLDGDDLPFLLEQARSERADIVEIRLDVWGNFFREEMFEKLARFKAKVGIPMLVSFRGGHPFPAWWQPVHWRALAHASLIDIEWNAKYPWRQILQNVKKCNLGLIISHHDYQATPSEKNLIKIARAAYAKKADIVKIATRPKSEADIRTLLAVNARFAPKRLITVMGMGPLGTLSRLVGPIFHTCLLYGYIGTPTASGQLPYRDLQERIRSLYPRYDQELQMRQSKLLTARLP